MNIKGLKTIHFSPGSNWFQLMAVRCPTGAIATTRFIGRMGTALYGPIGPQGQSNGKAKSS